MIHVRSCAFCLLWLRPCVCGCSRVFKNLDYRNLGLIEVYDLSQRLLQETVERSKPLNRLRCLSCTPTQPPYPPQSQFSTFCPARLLSEREYLYNMTHFPHPLLQTRAGRDGATSEATKMATVESPRVQIDERAPIGEQILAVLRAQSSRVMDLFRAWDSDGDALISKKEVSLSS